MAISSINSSTALAPTAAQIMKPFDANNDGTLSADEFLSLLTRLVSVFAPGVEAGASSSGSTLRTATSSASPAAATTSAKVYRAVPGWDVNKLNDPTHLSPKYVFQRGVQDLGLTVMTEEQLANEMVPYMRAHGYPNAVSKGDDLYLNGPDDPSPFDVIYDVGGANLAAWYNPHWDHPPVR